MAPSGEAWLRLDENPKERGAKPVVGMVDRRAAGPGDPAPPFELDERSTESLHPLLENLQRGDELRVGEGTNKEVIGILTAPSIGKPLDYGFLEGEKWVRPESFETAGALPWNSNSSAILKHADVQGGEAGKGISAWGLFQAEEGGTPAAGQGLILGHLQEGKWTFPKVPLDALALTGALKGPTASVEPQALKADGATVWIQAKVTPPEGGEGEVVARYDGSTGRVAESWCSLGTANECGQPLGDAAVPDAIVPTSGGEEVALSLTEGAVDVYEHGEWSSVLTAGYAPSKGPTLPGGDAFTDANHGWLGGEHGLGHWSPRATSGQLSPWPLPDRSPLTRVALPPASQVEGGESGALAVGLGGTTLSYDAGKGWLVQPTPPRAHKINLLGVAFAGPSSAFAVGQFGLILRWDGTSWSEDPQSSALTQSQLDAVAFGPSGEGWAVGADGTILHYDGHAWSREN